MSVEGLFVHGGDLWRINTPLSCLQPPQQGKTLIYTVKYIAINATIQTIIANKGMIQIHHSDTKRQLTALTRTGKAISESASLQQGKLMGIRNTSKRVCSSVEKI
ncbi:hypothetical protein EGD00_20745 [Pectobacterium carotovorum subsp. carotovorum]|nr:hypothetical protein EGD00_20745 [Pectobacterium carotovorum subsp. carotovorum]